MTPTQDHRCHGRGAWRSNGFVTKDKRAAVELYLKASREKLTADELVEMISKPGFAFTLTPNGVMKYAEQMFKTSVIKTKPQEGRILRPPTGCLGLRG
jgi:hypothetical protein